METIFGNSLAGGQSVTRLGDSDEDYEAIVRALIDDAVDFEESILAGTREENQKYYYGLLPSIEANDEGYEEINKSTFVSTDVRDTVMAVLPSLIRIFTSTEAIAYFVPNTEQQQDFATQAYDYANYVFYEDNEGFLTLHSLFKDALTVRMGIAKVWTDNDEEVTEQSFQNVTEEQYAYLIDEAPDLEVTELEENGDGTANITVRHMISKPLQKVAAVPPEEFRISRHATSIEKPPLIGHERMVPLSDIVKMGHDPEDLRDYISTGNSYSEERYMRNPGLTNEMYLLDGVLFGEYFIRVDKDGDGIDELRCIKTVGDNHTIIEDYVVNDHMFAVFNGDPRPHTVIGDCLADLAKDIQRMKSKMFRGQADNLSEAITPRTVVNELTTNVEDAMSDEVGAIIRTRGDPNAAVAFSKTPYVGAEVQETINYLDTVRASRTGITEASKGLDPKALQSTALSGIEAIVSGAQERIELIARILAETGMKRMLKLLLREIVAHPNKPRTVQLRGKWTEVNPSLYDPTMRVKVNPSLGKGTDIIRMQLLQDIRQTQMMIMEKFGIANNPVVTPVEFLNTITDLLELGNIKNVGRYFKPVTPEVMAGINNAPNEPDPATVLAQAELEKVKAGTAKAISQKDTDEKRLLIDAQKARDDADYKRDKLTIDATLDAMKIKADTLKAPEGLLSMNSGE